MRKQDTEWTHLQAFLDAMLKAPPSGRRKSPRAAAGGCSGTQTPSRTSQGASRKRERGSRGSKA